MTTAAESKHISRLFTKEAHHKNLTVIFIVQNLFYLGGEMHTCSLNANYPVLYKIPRDKFQVRYLADQFFHENSKVLTMVCQPATQDPHSYLLIDHYPEMPEQYRSWAIYSPGNKFYSICQFHYKKDRKCHRERKPLNSKELSNISPLVNTKKLFQALMQRVPITLSNKFVTKPFTQHEDKFPLNQKTKRYWRQIES